MDYVKLTLTETCMHLHIIAVLLNLIASIVLICKSLWIKLGKTKCKYNVNVNKINIITSSIRSNSKKCCLYLFLYYLISLLFDNS